MSKHTSHLRRSLAAATAEGVVTEFAAACSNPSAIAAWAIYLGAGTKMVGLLGALPFLAQLFQLPAAFITAQLGVRRSTIGGLASSRLVFLALIALPLLPIATVSRQTLLIAVAALSAVLGVIGANGWSAWMAEVVPSAIRGRYFGRRAALCTLGAATASLGIGSVLDAARRHDHLGMALGGCAAVVVAVGVTSAALLSRLHQPHRTVIVPDFRPAKVFAPLFDRKARSVLAFQIAWGIATGLSGTFYALYMVEGLKIGFLGATLHAVTVSLARTVAAPMWGRAIDRVGIRPVLVTCSLCLSATGLLWVVVRPSMIWILAIDAIVSGTLDSGHLLASLTLPLRASPRENRPFYVAAFGMASGLAFGIASISGGALAAALPARVTLLGLSASGYGVLFLLAAILRAFAGLVATQMSDPGARSATALLSYLFTPAARTRAGVAQTAETDT